MESDVLKRMANEILDLARVSKGSSKLIESAAALAVAYLASGWNTDIASAPHDGTRVMLWDGTDAIFGCFYLDGWQDDEGVPTNAFAWQPVPDGPQS